MASTASYATDLKVNQEQGKAKAGLQVERYFTRAGVHPYDEIEWEQRSASITNEKGRIVFEQSNVEIPKAWSMMATNVVVSKYFRGPLGTPQREHSVRQMIGRVVDTITGWGKKDGYFATEQDAEAFADELTHILVHQKACFNSPVWFNCGIEEKPQCSACFILSVDDTMDSILDWYRKEGVIFKGGSGSGVNLSRIRSSKEQLGGGGTASGPVSFMKAADASAGVIKSGGKTRRAAKMVILNVDHPDIEEFIKCKVAEEKKAWALIEAGYDASLDGPAYGSVFFQNANNSVRVSDEFMQAVQEDREWKTRYVTNGEVCETFKARDLLRMIAESTYFCGDPGMQFDTTINDWHTCSNAGRINASNPCSEYMHLDNSACNLASLNLLKFLRDDGVFDTESFRRAVDIIILAQDILVDNSSYPTAEITANAHGFRELGLGYANLGALLMSLGLPYDSDAGRGYAAAVSALMSGEGYLQSARIAAATEAFAGYEANRQPMLRVLNKHRSQAYKISPSQVPLDLLTAAREVWDQNCLEAEKHGVKNSQISVLAPTGTIAFMMDCDTTGVEPDIALVKYKKLVGGGLLEMVNNTVPRALKRLGYDLKQTQEIVEYIDEHKTIEGAPHVKDDDLPVFDCAFKPANGVRTIHYMGHVRMMGAVQPFISGAISKTINMPNEASVEDIMQAYMESWKLGLKAVAIYRDGSKRTQPLNTSKDKEEKKPVAAEAKETRPLRRRLPDERRSITHKFDIAGHEGYIIAGMYEDGQPGEIFITMSKEGSTISGLMDSFATAISIALQYGVPLRSLVDKFSHMRFEPSGFTKNPDIPMAKSIMDYIFRWLASKFLDGDAQQEVGVVRQDAEEKENVTVSKKVISINAQAPRGGAPVASISRITSLYQQDAPPCPDCGAIMIRSGACYKCLNCGAVSGCS
ncbi:MAG: vitamin B12-dependent ribonucleotide reductase [Deltaproteobacteria bacterium]|nr:vitamin B12-dependent ribonucleotide reductase [Deltaproteobacteria bacterium]